MNVNIVSIDPSLISTGLTVNGHIYAIVSDKMALTKSYKLKKWFARCEDEQNSCEIVTIDTSYGNTKKYAELEISKLTTFQSTTDLINSLIDKHVDPKYNTVCLIEGYSYSSAAGPLIDLVGFGTTVRKSMQARGELVVLAPTSLKKESAKLTYPVITKGKKVEWRNYNGVAGGSFSKHDMYLALTEMTTYHSSWQHFLKVHEDEVMNAKDVPKPIEDLNDSLLLYFVGKEYWENSNQDFNRTVEQLRRI